MKNAIVGFVAHKSFFVLRVYSPKFPCSRTFFEFIGSLVFKTTGFFFHIVYSETATYNKKLSIIFCIILAVSLSFCNLDLLLMEIAVSSSALIM